MTEEPRCTCADRDGRYWCLLHDPEWVDEPVAVFEYSAHDVEVVVDSIQDELNARLAAVEADAERLAAALRLPPFIELRHIKDEALRLHDAKRSQP
jgi:hypothetical protein